MMTEFTIALFFLAMISLSQGDLRERLDGEIEIKPEILSRYDDASCTNCELMLDLELSTGLKMELDANRYNQVMIQLDKLHCITEVRTFRTESKNSWDPMECKPSDNEMKPCQCTAFDCSAPQPVVGGMMDAETYNPSDGEIEACAGILVDYITVAMEDGEVGDPFEIYELALVAQDRTTWEEIVEDEHEEDGHEGQYSLAVCHSINVLLSVTALLIAIFF